MAVLTRSQARKIKENPTFLSTSTPMMNKDIKVLKFNVYFLLFLVVFFILQYLLIATIVISHQAFLSLHFYPLREKLLFQSAIYESFYQNKSLLVFGDPYSGLINQIFEPTYLCGDLCIDYNGCPRCRQNMKLDLNTLNTSNNFYQLKQTGPHIVYISAKLEYSTDIENMFRELSALVETPKDIFIFYEKPSLSTLLNKHYYIIKNAPPENDCLIYQTTDYKTISEPDKVYCLNLNKF